MGNRFHFLTRQLGYAAMVFFTSILIITILYFLQADGLIYVTVIALMAELINIFLTHTVAKSVEKNLTARHRKAIEGYIKRIKNNANNIKDLEKIQDDASSKLYKANSKIKELEKQLKAVSGEALAPPPSPAKQKPPVKQKKKKPPPRKPKAHRDHLPSGSNRKPPPV